MDYSLLFSMVFSVVGGLGIFLLGMRNMSDGLQAIAGNNLRKLVGAVTNNRLLAVGVGTTVTCIIQSSSVTTVMTVGFVNSGLMTLRQAIGVIMGANIGTTITGWILVLAIGKYGLPILGVAAFFLLFSKNERVRYLAMAIMGVGMVFFGLELMKNGFKPIRSMPEFERWFRVFTADSYVGVLKCALAGCILTFLVQSSSATLGITMGLALTGVIAFESAAALVLGENIGTTITAYLASLGTNTNARRAAYAHVIFNMFGVAWITALFPVYLHVVTTVVGTDPGMMVLADGTETYPYVRAGIAAVHTGFNVANTLLFLPLVPVMAKLLKKLVPAKPYKEPSHLTHLDVRLMESPVVLMEQSRKEILLMGDHVWRMMAVLRETLTEDSPDDAHVKMLFRREEILDHVQHEISTFLTDLLSQVLPHRTAEEARFQLRMADEYESVSDTIVAILKLDLRLRNAGLHLANSHLADILEIHDRVAAYFKLIHQAHVNANTAIASKAHPEGDAVTHLFRELRERHLKRLSKERIDPLLSTIYPDMLNSYRRLKDHLLNIAEAVAGEK